MTSNIRFDPDAIRALAQILKETDLTEIELVEMDQRLRLVRSPAPQIVAAAPVMTAPLAAAAPPAAVAAAPAPAAPVDDAKNPDAVTSPMVGVAYLAPEPGAAPFIQPGAKVAQGQTLLLIEAMKTFNQIKAPRAGTVSRILVQSGDPVEFGAPLLILE